MKIKTLLPGTPVTILKRDGLAVDHRQLRWRGIVRGRAKGVGKFKVRISSPRMGTACFLSLELGELEPVHVPRKPTKKQPIGGFNA
jgi:hypothetical protein